MELRESHRKMIQKMRGGWPAMAGALGMSETQLKNRVYQIKGQAVSTEISLVMQDLSGTTCFAEAIAALSGGTFVRLPELGELDNDELLAKWNAVYAKVGELSLVFNSSTQDGHVDGKERECLVGIGNEVHRHLQELLALTFKVYCRG